MRARDLGIVLPGTPGPLNAITDIAGVEVGLVTIVRDDPARPEAAARTGVTAILPLGRSGAAHAVAAGVHSMNGNGEMTGSHWLAETGALSGPVMITNTHAVGTVHRGVVEWFAREHPARAAEWLLPVVAETWDGYLNAINEPHVHVDDAGRALDAARSGPVAEGSVGGGTGMNCYQFKGGTGTASRRVAFGGRDWTVGVLLQANFGDRDELVIRGVPMGDLDVPNPIADPAWVAADRSVRPPGGAGSVIVVVGTDAPLLPHQCSALARRVPLGLARTGTAGSHFSGDIFLAFSTGSPGALDSGFPDGSPDADRLRHMDFVPWNRMDPFYTAVVEAVEEAVLNALVSNADMTGRSGHWVPALPAQAVADRLSTARSGS